MTFLTPLTALMAASVCVPVLVVLYMLRLRRRPVRVSSTLLWRSAVDDLQANVPLRWLRPSWLLFLHLLILALFVAALGRPALSMGAGAGGRVVILLDRSASMKATDGPGGTSRWLAAQDRCVQLIDEALGGVGTTVALVTFAAEPRVVVGFTGRSSELRDAVRGCTPTDQPANLAAAFRAVEALSAADGDESSARRPVAVRLVTEGSLGPVDGLTLAGATVDLVSIVPPSGETGRDNLGIAAFAARRDYEDPALTRVLVRVENASETVRDSALAFSLDGRIVERRALRVPGRSATEGASATFDLYAPRGGVVGVRLDRADLLAADNSASLVLPPATEPRIVLVQPDSGTPNPAEERAATGNAPARISPPWLLADALAELRAPLRVVGASEYERLASGATLDADLVVFDRVSPRATPPCASLSFGAGLPIAGLVVEPGSGPGSVQGDAGGTYVVAWSRSHPVLRDVSLDSVYASGRPSIAWSVGATRMVALADGAAGPVVALALDGPHRRILVAFDPAVSNWPLQPGFPIFLASAADYLTQRGEETAGRAFTTEQPVSVRPGPGAGSVVLRGPGTLTGVTGAESGRAVSFGLIELVGVYAVEPPGRDAAIALNLLSPSETSLQTTAELRVAGRTLEQRSGFRAPREVWTWCVIGAAGLLMVEWVVYAARMRV